MAGRVLGIWSGSMDSQRKGKDANKYLQCMSQRPGREVWLTVWYSQDQVCSARRLSKVDGCGSEAFFEVMISLLLQVFKQNKEQVKWDNLQVLDWAIYLAKPALAAGKAQRQDWLKLGRKNCLGAQKMVQQLGVLAVQLWWSRFSFQHPPNKLSIWHTPVILTLSWGRSRRNKKGLAGFHPSWQNMNLGFWERPWLKGICREQYKMRLDAFRLHVHTQAYTCTHTY